MFLPSILPPEQIIYHKEQHLILRRSVIHDAEALIEAIQASLPALHQFMPWSHFPNSNTVASQRKRLNNLTLQWNDQKEYVYHIFLQQGDDEYFIGCIGLHPRCSSNRGLEVGYWIRSGMAGRGLCTLATKMVILMGFHVMDLHRIQVGCDDANIGSRCVIEKVGFGFEALQRNMGFTKVPQHIVQNGWKGTGNTRTYALIPEDLSQLDWVESISSNIRYEFAEDLS